MERTGRVTSVDKKDPRSALIKTKDGLEFLMLRDQCIDTGLFTEGTLVRFKRDKDFKHDLVAIDVCRAEHSILK